MRREILFLAEFERNQQVGAKMRFLRNLFTIASFLKAHEKENSKLYLK